MPEPIQPTLTGKHILCLTIPAYGHIIPLLEFAKKVSARHHVTFVVSSEMIEEIRQREVFTTEKNDRLEIVSLDDGVAFHFDKSAPDLKRVLDLVEKMEPTMTSFLRSLETPSPQESLDSFRNEQNNRKILSIDRPVDAVVFDRFLCSLVLPICDQLGIPGCVFNCSASISGLDVTETTPSIPDEEARKIVPGGSTVTTTQVYGQQVTDTMKKFLLMVNNPLPLASAILLNTFREADETALETLSVNPRTSAIPVYCVGPLFPTAERTNQEKQTMEAKIITWMDRQKLKSVIYVSFGSLAYLDEEQAKELSKALLTLNRPFILSMRSQYQWMLSEELRDGLNVQFEREDRKFLVVPWAPQKMILGHEACGVFVTHAGWNSTLEGIVSGVPMVAWPMFADQPVNGQWMADKGVAALIPDTRMEGGRLVPVEEIVQAVRRLKTGDYHASILDMQAKAKRAVAEGGSTQADIAGFLDFDFAT